MDPKETAVYDPYANGWVDERRRFWTDLYPRFKGWGRGYHRRRHEEQSYPSGHAEELDPKDHYSLDIDYEPYIQEY